MAKEFNMQTMAGEKDIEPFWVNGLYETHRGEKVVLEVHGEFWQGNPTKFSLSTVNSVNQMSLGKHFEKKY